MKIHNQIKNKEKLTMQELGLLTYIQNNLDSDGLFQHHLATTGDFFAVPNANPTVHRVTKSLIKKGYIIVIRKSKLDAYGHRIPPVLKPIPIPLVEQASIPIPPVKDVENKAKPIPSGMLEAITTCKPIRMSVCINDKASSNVTCHNAAPVEQGFVSSTRVTAPALRICPHGDCTNILDDTEDYCYRHVEAHETQPAAGVTDGDR